MKIKFIIAVAAMLLALQTSKARGIIFYSAGEEIEKVYDLPQSEEYQIQASDGQWYHADLGVMHEQFSLFWIPLWNYGEETYVLFTDKKVGNYDMTYVDLTDEEIQYLHEEFGVPLTPSLPFWDVYGGKLVAIAIIALIILYTKLKNKKEENLTQVATDDSTDNNSDNNEKQVENAE